MENGAKEVRETKGVKECNGICNHTCNKICEKSIGYKLTKFISEVDLVESEIGKLSSGGKDKTVYITTGIQINCDFEHVRLLSTVDKNTSISINPKFNDKGKINTYRILRDFLYSQDNISDKEKILDNYSRFEKNKLLLFPFKPRMDCEVLVKKEDNKYEKKKTSIDIIKWNIDNESKELKCTIITEPIEIKPIERVKVSIEDYGSLIVTYNVARITTSSSKAFEMLKMTQYGFFKTLAIKLSDREYTEIIIDNTYMYIKEKSVVSVVAKWLDGNLVFLPGVSDETKEMYNYIKEYVWYINNHRKYIAPYGLYECNEVIL